MRYQLALHQPWPLPMHLSLGFTSLTFQILKSKSLTALRKLQISIIGIWLWKCILRWLIQIKRSIVPHSSSYLLYKLHRFLGGWTWQEEALLAVSTCTRACLLLWSLILLVCTCWSIVWFEEFVKRTPLLVLLATYHLAFYLWISMATLLSVIRWGI